ncbi:Cysteine-rich repeat secretory protein [Quillaja saponaria]|uniref:Cysteine-rich repeat secretory protein n=1 Tax=Quillaja saponaria TaxID=32244 RepID=A0AAD7QIS3_QUISA|nr:Cysteine-rich repeat secretory protein [Quillaja saponaria]
MQVGFHKISELPIKSIHPNSKMLKMKTMPLMISLTLPLLCLPSFLSADDYTLSKYSCFNSETYANGSDFATNVNELLASLSSTLVPPTGFGEGSVGQDENLVFGFGLCRGDIVSTSDCNTCLDMAITEIRTSCPNKRGAIYWTDLCLIKYSDVYFFEEIDDTNIYNVINGTLVPYPKTFDTQVNEFLSLLSTQFAPANPIYYASGQININTSTTLYGFVQCTGDLSPTNCTSCLDFIRSKFLEDRLGTRGARIGCGSCVLRYELYHIIFGARAIHNMVSNNNGLSYVTK